MNNIELICPSCEELLEIDSGFAGGVCRCFHCGTLMTVPGGLGPQRPKRVTRPDRPERPTPQPAGEISAMNLPPETVIFRTEDGREVRLAAGQTIPTARAASEGWSMRRGMLAAVLLCVLAALSGGLLMVSSTGRSGGQQSTAASPQATPPNPWDDLPAPPTPPAPADARPAPPMAQVADGNPFLMQTTQFLGLSLRARVVIAIDASKSSEPWIADLKEAIVRGVRSPRMLQVICQRGEFTWMYPSSPGVFEPEQAGAWRSFLADAQPDGDPDPGALLLRALAVKPEQIILVLGPEVDAAALPAALTGEGLTSLSVLDVVAIDHDSPILRELAARNSGRYRSITTDELRTWHSLAPAR